MSAPRSRRAALRAGAVAIGALCVPALAIAAPAVDLDAELLSLVAQHPAAAERWHAAARIAHRVERIAIAARPERPDALLSRPTDFPSTSFNFGLSEPADADGRRWYGARAVEWLGRPRVFRSWSADASDMMPDPEAEARRVEILAAAEAHAAACLASDRDVGLCAAEAAVEVAYDALAAIEDRLNDLAPRTLTGLAAKATWAAGSEDEGVMEAVLYQVAAFVGAAA